MQNYVSSYAPECRSLVLVYDQTDRFFWARELNVGLRNSAYWDVEPYLKPLLDLIGEFGQYAVAVVGDTRTRFFKVLLGEIEEYTRPAGQVVPSIERMILSEDIDQLILAGAHVTTEKILQSMPARLKRITIGCVEVPFDAAADKVLKSVLPLIESFEREKEAQLIRDLISAAEGTSRAVTGLGRTLESLNRGFVTNLVFMEGMQTSGYECSECGALFSENRERCGYCGSGLLVVENLSERIMERATENAARIHILSPEGAAALNKAGGVGAFIKAAQAAGKH
jgi:DNA-directed RNA polymerase subunit RPC12/RpoP